MSYDDAIRLLNQHLTKLRSFNNDFEAWLDTAVELITETFGLLSQQHSNFTSLRADYKIARISDKTPQLVSRFSQRANQQISSMIELLQERKQQAIQKAEIEKQQQVALKIEREKLQKEEGSKQQQKTNSQPATSLTTNIPTTSSQRVKAEKMDSKDKKHYKIGIGLFWSVAIPLAAGIFAFGLYVGTTKFDQEKIDLSDKNKELREYNKILNDTLSATRDSLRLMRDTSAIQKRTIQSYFHLLTEEQKDSITLGSKA